MGGLVGPGLLDADVYGPVFTCASGLRIARAIEYAECGGGVVLLVSNHSGDVLNARLALRRARQMGIRVEPVWLGDDIATAPRQQLAERRGLGGLLFALKIGGAAAEAGEPLDKVVRVMQKTNERTATLSVAVRPPTHPASGKPLFEIPDGQMEIGTGVHGEVGVYRGPLLTADAIVDIMIAKLTDDLMSFQPSSLLVFINGAGGTSRTELHIVFRRAWYVLARLGLTPHASVVESLFTTQEMGGFSLSLCAVDAELASYWDAPASAACFRWPYR
jgi:dihydroxyacetone kinase-like protein